MTRRGIRWPTAARYGAASPKAHRLQMLVMKALSKGRDALTDREREILDSAPGTRAKPVQHEAHEARALAVMAAREWWYPGLWRLEHRTANWREADARAEEGAKTGMPDFMLWVPPVYALELKSPQYKPKRETRDCWWLYSFDGDSKYGLRQDQAAQLRMLHDCGCVTTVAYGADEAFAWLCEQAGPQPDVLPTGWETT